MCVAKSKFDMEIESFERAFQSFKDKKIAIYGTGRMTATLLGGIKEYQIVGLCDRDESLVGKTFMDKPILSKEEVLKKADILVINTDATYWNTIYKRICDWDIPIYFGNGQKAALPQKAGENNPYWNIRREHLEKQIENKDIVSFDIFDTLLIRKVMSPYDVLRIVEIRLREKYGELDFCKLRKQAVAELKYPTYDEIYKKISEISGWSKKIVLEAKNWELETEELLITPRLDMVELCNRIMEKKEVYFVSDMYFTKDILLKFLHRVGVNAKREQVIVSCELRREKRSGELWKWYKDNIVLDKTAIHIGDNTKADVKNAQKQGIDSLYVMSVLEMLNNSSVQDVVPHIISLQSSLAMGILCAEIFNSPFALNETKGMITFREEKQAGYVLLGNAMYNFAVWLIQKTKRDGIEQLLFFAREGYLLLPLYQYMQRKLRNEEGAEGTYLEVSRRVVFVASICNVEDAYEVAKFPYKGTAKAFLHDRFGLNIEDLDIEALQMEVIQSNDKELYQFVYKYKDMILENARKERANYLRYLRAIIKTDKVGIVDSTLYGTTQFYLQKVMNQRMKGYYFCACVDENNKFCRENDMSGCFQGIEDRSGKECAMHKASKFNEAYFTAPHGMMVYMDEKGEPHYTEDMGNQRNFDVRYIMQEGIMDYLSQMVELQNALSLKEVMIDPVFADKLYGCMMNEGMIPSSKMKTSFYFDNKILDNRESGIWE